MNLDKYIQEWSHMRFDKNSRIVLLIVYALIMFITIQNELNTIVFVLLFAVTPISIYFFVKKKFSK